MPFVSGDVIRKIGFIAPLGLKHLYIDNFYEEIALALSIYGYSPDIRIRHLHFSNGAPMDKTYEERQLEGDAEAWQAFVNNGLLDTISVLLGDVSSPPSNNLQHTGHVTFVCVQTNNYDGCGHRYVNNLYRMLKENSNYPVELVCFTDKSDGIKSGIKVRQLPSDMDGWWGKLYMFKRHLFPDGTRLCFLDLDTLILKNVDELRKYSGKFATLRDFFYPTQIGPGIILWEAGEYTSSIWEEWVSQGKLKHDGGDLWWLNTLDQGRFAKDADKLQDVFPGMFCSYKADDITDKPDVPVVCFHGRPKQTDFPPDHWVSAVWNG